MAERIGRGYLSGTPSSSEACYWLASWRFKSPRQHLMPDHVLQIVMRGQKEDALAA